jgi:hypothetical protein
MENATRMTERSRQLTPQRSGDAATQADLLENIWKLENHSQNHSDWLQRLEILIKVWTDSVEPDSPSGHVGSEPI